MTPRVEPKQAALSGIVVVACQPLQPCDLRVAVGELAPEVVDLLFQFVEQGANGSISLAALIDRLPRWRARAGRRSPCAP